MPRRPGLRRREKPSLSFIPLRQYRGIAPRELSQRIFIDHPQSYDAPQPQGTPRLTVAPQPIPLSSDEP